MSATVETSVVRASKEAEKQALDKEVVDKQTADKEAVAGEHKNEIKASQLLQRICANKVASKDPNHPYVLTPAKDYCWNDAIEEARDRGISIKTFGDTADKIVLHPGHLGYEFNYFWGRGVIKPTRVDGAHTSRIRIVIKPTPNIDCSKRA